MNHPWQNGFLAGLAYLFFVARLADASRLPWGWPRFGAVLGCAVAVYSIVTAGFPEASAMSALLVFLVLSPPLARGLSRGNRPAPFALGRPGARRRPGCRQRWLFSPLIHRAWEFQAGIGAATQPMLPFGSTSCLSEGPRELAGETDLQPGSALPSCLVCLLPGAGRRRSPSISRRQSPGHSTRQMLSSCRRSIACSALPVLSILVYRALPGDFLVVLAYCPWR